MTHQLLLDVSSLMYRAFFAMGETVKTPDGSYELTAHTSVVDGHRYLDYTEVVRR